jgi:hypothetical protein
MSDGIEVVPVLHIGPFDSAMVKALAEGKSMVAGATNIREGVVIEPLIERHERGLGRVQLKIVSNSFLEKDNA